MQCLVYNGLAAVMHREINVVSDRTTLLAQSSVHILTERNRVEMLSIRPRSPTVDISAVCLV